MFHYQRDWIDNAFGTPGQNAGRVARGYAVMIVGLIITIYLTCKGTELIIRQLLAHRDHKVLWGFTTATLGFLAAAGISGFQSATLIGLTIASFVFAVITAKVVETQYNQLFERRVTMPVVIDEVLHKPWFALAA
jgi:hypothetical protein